MPVSDFCKTPLWKKVIKLKNCLAEIRKRIHPCVIKFHKVSNLKSAEQHYFCLLQLYSSWRQEIDLKHEDGTCKRKYKENENEIVENLKRHEPSLDID